MMSLTTVEAKKLYFLTADDLHALPRTTLYGGFGTGRASYLFNETDLEAAAIAKYGETGYSKKVAARQKRLDNKRRRDEEAAAAEASFLKSNPDVAAKKRKQEANTKKLVERNRKIQGEKPWNLVITSPESVAGTKAVLMMKDFPPIGWPDSSYVSCSGDSPANSYGNIHGFKGKSSEEDKEMVFETKWKLWGQRHTGTLRVQVKPSDKAVEPHEDKDGNDEEEPLMVVGKFDCGVNEGVRRWQFKGYR